MTRYYFVITCSHDDKPCSLAGLRLASTSHCKETFEVGCRSLPCNPILTLLFYRYIFAARMG